MISRNWIPALFAFLLVAATPLPAASPEEIVIAEHAFATDVAALGIREGFLRWLAPTGVVFRPGPVNGIKSTQATPVSPALLSWQPAKVVMSASADLAWSTGPWSYHAVAGREAIAWGEFVSIWRRQADGRWKVVLDAGVDHAHVNQDSVVVATQVLSDAARTGNKPLWRRQTLWQADDAYAKAAGTGGVAGAIEQFAASDIRRLRDGSMPILGVSAARDSAAARNERGVFMSLAQFISDKGDLGYTYGTFVETRGAVVDSSYYVHIWKRGATRPWELSLDLLLAQPKSGK